MDQISSLEYNTERSLMVIPEYGRNVQNMIDYCLTIADREERSKCAKAIIKVMAKVKPQLKEVEDYDQKLWDHLFIMSNFELDIDSPYPKPTADFFNKKPEKIPYPHNNIKYGHYGIIMENLIKAATKLEDGEEKKFLTKRIANLLKTSYLLWNRNTVNNEVIVKHLEEFSNGELTIEAKELTDSKEILSHFKKNYNVSNPIINKNSKRNKKSKSNYKRK